MGSSTNSGHDDYPKPFATGSHHVMQRSPVLNGLRSIRLRLPLIKRAFHRTSCRIPGDGSDGPTSSHVNTMTKRITTIPDEGNARLREAFLEQVPERGINNATMDVNVA